MTGRGRWCSRSRLTVTHFGRAAAAFGKRVVVVAAPAVVALTAATAVALTVLPIVLVIWHASVVVESTAQSNSSTHKLPSGFEKQTCWTESDPVLGK